MGLQMQQAEVWNTQSSRVERAATALMMKREVSSPTKQASDSVPSHSNLHVSPNPKQVAFKKKKKKFQDKKRPNSFPSFLTWPHHQTRTKNHHVTTYIQSHQSGA
jgi:hypothetical protein